MAFTGNRDEIGRITDTVMEKLPPDGRPGVARAGEIGGVSVPDVNLDGRRKCRQRGEVIAMVLISETGAEMPGTSVCERRGAPSRWRVVVALPAVVGSTLLMLVLFGWAGRWEPLLMLAWLASGAAVFTRAGERVAVRIGCGFRPLSIRQQELLGPAWLEVLDRCGVSAGGVDLYLQRSRETNAYAAGGRSVGVTTGVAANFLAQTLTHADLSGLMAHEVGHQALGATRFTLVTGWLAAPWRCATRLVIGMVLRSSGRQPRRLLAALALTAAVVGVVQSAQHHQPVVAAVLATLTLCGMVCPLAEAVLSRRDELAADRYAAHAGYGLALSGALRRIGDVQQHRRRSLLERALARHPTIDRRLDELHKTNLAMTERRPDPVTRLARQDHTAPVS